MDDSDRRVALPCVEPVHDGDHLMYDIDVIFPGKKGVQMGRLAIRWYEGGDITCVAEGVGLEHLRNSDVDRKRLHGGR